MQQVKFQLTAYQANFAAKQKRHEATVGKLDMAREELQRIYLLVRAASVQGANHLDWDFESPSLSQRKQVVQHLVDLGFKLGLIDLSGVRISW